MKKYLVYDWRALGGTDDASIYSVENTLEEAIRCAEEDFGGVIYSYDVDGENLINEKFEISVMAKVR